MATTTYSVNDALTNKLWAKKLNSEMLKATYFGKFMGEDSDNMIQRKTELEQNAGDRITIGLRVQLSGDGVTENQSLVGNEEALSTYSDNLLINELAHAVRVRNKQTIDANRVLFNLRTEGKLGMTDWFSNRFDTCMANQLAGNTLVVDPRYTGNNPITAPTSVYRKGAATDDATINGDNTALFNIQILDAMVERAATATPMIRPIMVNGERKYIAFLHDYQVTDMRINTNAGQWLDIEKAALAGGAGSKSTIYTGAIGEYNGVVLHKWNRLPMGISNAGVQQTSTRRAVLCGAQAAAVGFGKENSKSSHFIWIEDLFDYERELGISAQVVWGIKKSVFNAKDFGVVVATTYAVAH